MYSMERTHYERIIGGSEEEQEAAREELQNSFDKKSEDFTEHEIEKTPEDRELIKKTESIVDRMVTQYGGEPKNLPIDHIYILKPGSVDTITEGEHAGALTQPHGLKIGIEQKESKFLFASGVAHELFHLKSYKSARLGNSPENIHLYRNGLQMYERKDPNVEVGEEKEYFSKLEEAIVAECVRKFLNELGKDEEFQEETEALNRLRNWIVEYHRSAGVEEKKMKIWEEEIKYIADPIGKVKDVLAYSDDEQERQAYSAGLFQRAYEKGEVEELERYVYREELYNLLDELVEKSDGKFKSREEVFEKFANANFSGHYLPLARMVEGILGKGTFRELAERFSEEAEKEQENSETNS